MGAGGARYEGPPAPPRKLNALLPDDVAVLASEAVAPGFDARHDATSRAYCYRVLARRARSAFERGRALWWPHPLDRAALDACAAALVGTHDFTAFTPTETEHVRFERDVRSRGVAARSGDVLEFWIEADAFMRHMNRVLVGTMLEVAGGRRIGRGLRGPARRRAALARRARRRRRRASTSSASATTAERCSGGGAAHYHPGAMRVLLTNDDGIEAEGLQALRRALLDVPGIELAVVAPDGNRSATARSITTRRPLWVERGRLRATARTASRPTARPSTACASRSSG